mgnify:FL=1
MTKEVLKAAKGTGSVEELQKLAKENGITPITLGKRILRTETAGMTTTAILLYELD